jgi:hypothetical protein
MTCSTLRRFLVASFVLGLFAVNSLPAQVSGAAAAAAAFRRGLVATAIPTKPGPMAFLQAVALTWPAYSAEKRYCVLRAVAQNGPWVADHEVVGIADTVRRLPPFTTVYFRVVALHQETIVKGWTAVDTTTVSTAFTVRSTMVSSVEGSGFFSIAGLCSFTAPSTVRLSWARVPDANGYRLEVLLSGPSGTTVPQPSILVRDTVLVQTNVAAGTYTYIVDPQYDIANWPGPGQTLSLVEGGLKWLGAIVGPGTGPGCR